MNRRNFLKFSAGLPALALFPWSNRKTVTTGAPFYVRDGVLYEWSWSRRRWEYDTEKSDGGE